MIPPIYIPTIGRSRIKTLEYLEPQVYKSVTLVTNKAQLAELQDTYPAVRVVSTPATAEPGAKKADGWKQGIAPTRQWILEEARRLRQPRIVMFDDDLRFYVRKDRKNWDDWHMRTAEPADMTELLHDMDKLIVRGYAFVGLSAKQGNNRKTAPVLHSQRCWTTWAVDVQKLFDYGIRADGIPGMEDFWVQMHLLTRGEQTAMICDRAHGQDRINAPGGCNTFGTSKIQQESVATLRKHFPDFVTLREIKTQTRRADYDVTFHGVKAFKHGISKLL